MVFAPVAQPDKVVVMSPKDYKLNTEAKKDKALGYKYYFDPSHPLSGKSGKVYEHRHEASVMLGRWLTSKEVVHHRDKDKCNNSHDNLEVMSCSEHARLHKMESLGQSLGQSKPLSECKVCGCLHKYKYYCSNECRNIGRRKVKNRPSKQELTKKLKHNSFLSVGREYGVSDNCIRKWLSNYERAVSPRTSNPEKG